MVDVKIASTLFVVVTPAPVEAVVDFGRIKEKHRRPDGEQQHCDAQQRSENQNEFSLPFGRLPYFVPLSHPVRIPGSGNRFLEL